MRLLLLAALAFSPAPARAAFTETGAGARAPGMGNAFVAIADDVHAIHYNPAGLGLLGRPEFASAYTRLFWGLTDGSNISNSFIGYAHPIADGRLGAAGAAWQNLALDNLYQEHTLYLSYGRKLTQGPGPGGLLLGGSGKYLMRSFGSFPEAGNALSGIAATGRADPVLSGSRSAGAPDLDLGLLYRLKEHYGVGLSLQHVTQPNVAFQSGAESRVPLSVRLGLGYRSLLSNLSLQYDTREAPGGGRDQIATVAGERWIPRLFIGDFGMRAGLNMGTRDLRLLNVGITYRTRRLGVDYAFAMPINSVASTAGNHRFGISLRFVRRDEPEESMLLLLEAMRQLKGRPIPELRAQGRGLTPTHRAILDEHLAAARALQAQARYREALDRLSKALTVSPADAELLKTYGRLNFVAQPIRGLAAYRTDPVQAALHEGIIAYVAGNDLVAIERTAYALSLNPSHEGLSAFLTQLEQATGLKRPALPPKDAKRLHLERLATQAMAAVQDGRYDEAIRLGLELAREDPRALPAWHSLGTAYFAIGDYRRALEAWNRAHKLDEDPSRRAAIRRYIKAIEKLLQRRAVAPRLPAAAPSLRPAGSPEQVQKLYNSGVDAYNIGDLQKAKAIFEEVLRLDTNYEPAAKALRRVLEEMAIR